MKVIRTIRLEMTDNNVTDIRMIFGDEKHGDWKYLLVRERGGFVQFINGDTLDVEK